jgi:antitoxin component YwqK of YwqJK toxin-antitoxin module
MTKLSGILFGIGLLAHTFAFAQAKTEINQYDEQGKAIGLWYSHIPADKGEPEQITIGNFDHGKKTGVWYVNDGKGNLTSIETFKLNVRDGEVKYFENGQLTCVGHYRGLNPAVETDTVHIVDPITGDEKWVSVPTERGSVKHGSWRFYDELSGRLIKEEQYQIDELIYKKDFSISPADSAHYQSRNKRLPHAENRLAPASKFKTKEPAKSLIGG